MRIVNTKLRNWRPVTAYSAAHHSESFIVSAIATVLLIRFLLQLTGYPQFGAGELHIAHVLWGGLGMGLALLALMNLMGDRPRAVAALLGGVGFGLFVDELGKYVTQDNDYFFEPTALLLYGLFLALWLLLKVVDARRSRGQRAFQANTLELLQEGLLYGLNTYERNELRYQLAQLKPTDELTVALRRLAAVVSQKSKKDELSTYIKLSQLLTRWYRYIVTLKVFPLVLYIVFVIQIILAAVSLVNFAGDLASHNPLDVQDALTRSNLGQLAGTVGYTFCVIVGMVKLSQDRSGAYDFFRRGLLINLFVTQFFAFYRVQFVAVFSLALNLLLLLAVNYLQQLERQQANRSSTS